MRSTRAAAVLLAFSGVPAVLAAQHRGTVPWSIQAGFSSSGPEVRDLGGLQELVLAGGIELRRGDLVVRAERAILRHDPRLVERLAPDRDGTRPPSRGPVPPASRRSIDQHALAERLQRILRAARGAAALTPPSPPLSTLQVDAFRTLYAEGDVVVTQGDLEIVSASRLFVSSTDDRAVFDDVVLRLYTGGARGEVQVVVVRGSRIVRQGSRFVGRDLSVTTCSAGEPHFEILSGEVEIIERGEQFEIRTRGSALAFSGVSVLPLPSLAFRTGEDPTIPIESVHLGYSEREGAEARVVIGGDLEPAGAALHEALGGSADDFRGDWRLGLGWIEARGFPIDGELTYAGEGAYFGTTDYFVIDDDGRDIREIRGHIDGTPIARGVRDVLTTRDRITLSPSTRIDLQAFDASDPAVMSEFHRDRWFSSELPETSAFFVHQADNRILTLGARGNIADFSYASSRELADRFVEELPGLTFDWIGEHLADLPADAPLLLSSSTALARLRYEYDPRSPLLGPDAETWRFDQELELAAPYLLGPIGFRPYLSGRFTHVSDSVTGEDDQRLAWGAGAVLSTRFQRVFRWRDDADTPHALRHVITPSLRFQNRFHVDDDPSRYHQFDAVDALDERADLRLGLLQRFQVREGPVTTAPVRELLWIDLAQNFTPISERDNQGHHLGLFEFETILRPRGPRWLPISNWQFVVEGEHDWNGDELRTLNVHHLFGVGDVLVHAEYRTDRTERGVIGGGILTSIRRRWDVSFHSLYDLETDELNRLAFTLSRVDHDWTVRLGTHYDVVTDDTSFRIDFEPRFGGLFRRRARSRDLAARDHASY